MERQRDVIANCHLCVLSAYNIAVQRKNIINSSRYLKFRFALLVTKQIKFDMHMQSIFDLIFHLIYHANYVHNFSADDFFSPIKTTDVRVVANS